MHSAATTQPDSDEELMRSLASGREDAIGPLYARYAPQVLAMASHAVGRPAGEEIVNDVFVSIWKNARSYDPARGPVRPWLLQIAHYRIANELRRRRRRPEVPADPEGPGLGSLPDPGPDQAEQTWTAYKRDALRRALAELPQAQRQALGLSFFEELPHDEIARVLELPLGTAKSRIRAGIKTLRISLAPMLALILLAAALAPLVLRLRSDLAREERALTMLTSSDTEALRLTAAEGVPAEVHGVYRARRGSPIAVLTLSNLPTPRPGRSYQTWFLQGGRWISLGTARPDSSGRARLLAEGPAFAQRPDAVQVTEEPERGSAVPTGARLIGWSAR